MVHWRTHVVSIWVCSEASYYSYVSRINLLVTRCHSSSPAFRCSTVFHRTRCLTPWNPRRTWMWRSAPTTSCSSSGIAQKRRCWDQTGGNSPRVVGAPKDLLLVTGTWLWCFQSYWECHHPNWRIHMFQRGRSSTNQIMTYEGMICVSIYAMIWELKASCLIYHHNSRAF